MMGSPQILRAYVVASLKFSISSRLCDRQTRGHTYFTSPSDSRKSLATVCTVSPLTSTR
jgi:hypothetical protein